MQPVNFWLRQRCRKIEQKSLLFFLLFFRCSCQTHVHVQNVSLHERMLACTHCVWKIITTESEWSPPSFTIATTYVHTYYVCSYIWTLATFAQFSRVFFFRIVFLWNCFVVVLSIFVVVAVVHNILCRHRRRPPHGVVVLCYRKLQHI